MALGSDGASVMMGARKGVAALLKEKKIPPSLGSTVLGTDLSWPTRSPWLRLTLEIRFLHF